MVFGKDDKTLISASGLIWDVDPAVLKARVCQMAQRDLTTAEWAKYVGSTAYSQTCGFGTAEQKPTPAQRT